MNAWKPSGTKFIQSKEENEATIVCGKGISVLHALYAVNLLSFIHGCESLV